MSLSGLLRWFHKWMLGWILSRPALFFAMRYYDAKNFFKERKEKKAQASKDRETRVRTIRSSSKMRGR